MSYKRVFFLVFGMSAILFWITSTQKTPRTRDINNVVNGPTSYTETSLISLEAAHAKRAEQLAALETAHEARTKDLAAKETSLKSLEAAQAKRAEQLAALETAHEARTKDLAAKETSLKSLEVAHAKTAAAVRAESATRIQGLQRMSATCDPLAQPECTPGKSSSAGNVTHRADTLAQLKDRFTERARQRCHDAKFMDLTDTHVQINDLMMDMYARILSIPPRVQDSAVTAPPFRVLDLGTGCGYKLHSIVSRYEVQGLGVDISRHALQNAHNKYGGDKNVRFCHGNSLEMEGLRGTADMVMEYAGSVYYAPDQCAAIHQALALLNTTGNITRGMFRGMVTGMSHFHLAKCLFQGDSCAPTYKKKFDYSAWCIHENTAVAFLSGQAFHPRNAYNRFQALFMFVVRGGAVMNLPPIQNFQWSSFGNVTGNGSLRLINSSGGLSEE